jgi:hypothetical protein
VKGYWINERQWQCPACGHVNNGECHECDHCNKTERPPDDEPIRKLSEDDIGDIDTGVEHTFAFLGQDMARSLWAGMAVTQLKGSVKLFTRHNMVMLRVEGITGQAALTPDQADQFADDLHRFARMARGDYPSSTEA